MKGSVSVGQLVQVVVGAVAHGGHCVARHNDQVVFVRHALPGETVLVLITSLGPKGRFARGDAVEIIQPHADRRVPPCPAAGPGGCGGCDWLHATPALARALKADVVREAMSRFAHVNLPPDFEVLDVGENPDGLGWRTRANFATDADGRAGFVGSRSNDVHVISSCPQLVDPLARGALARTWAPESRVRFVAPALGAALAFPDGRPPVPSVTEVAVGRSWEVAAQGFWQVHPRAADVLVAAVLDAIQPGRGQRFVDLYCGVGLFGISIAAHLDGDCSGDLIESDRRACALAGRNRGDLNLRVGCYDVGRWVQDPAHLAGVDFVVLDPPRSGAGAKIVAALGAAQPRTIAYVACDPVALARDTALLGEQGYRLDSLVCFDLFPSTHHVESVAGFVRRGD